MNDWTIETLKSYMDAILSERDRQYDTRFRASEIAVNAALAAQEKAVAAAFLASEKAIVKAEDAQKDYNVRSNEFRGQLDDQAKTLMPRTETLGLFKNIDDKLVAVQKSFEDKLEAIRVSNEKVFDSTTKEIAGLRESRSEISGKTGGLKDSWVILIGAVSLIVMILSISSAMYAFLR